MSDGIQLKCKLKLYVVGETVISGSAIQNLKKILKEAALEGKIDFEVIDIVTRPELAEEKQVMMTPALDREQPPPVVRLIGDLSDREEVLAVLGVSSPKKVKT